MGGNPSPAIRTAKLRARRCPVWGIARQKLQEVINQEGAGGVSPLEHGGLRAILPFLGGRSDAARRVVIRLYAVPVDACVDVDGGLR